jgi:hypothetical protein
MARMYESSLDAGIKGDLERGYGAKDEGDEVSDTTKARRLTHLDDISPL